MLQEAKITRPIALLFTGLDANQDLALTKAELDAAIPREFARADVDQSGVLTGFEMADWSRRMLGDREALPDLRAMDTDVNYTVTPLEFSGALDREFDRMDKDQNGFVTRADMLINAPQRMMDQNPQNGPPTGSRRPGGGGRGPGGGPGGGQGGGQPPF
jgi:hypothetical protein